MVKLELPANDACWSDSKNARSGHHFATNSCVVEIFQCWRDIDPKVWQSLYPTRCKDRRYYEITEDTLGNQFDHRYFVIRNSSGQVAVQPFFILRQDLTAGVTGRLRTVIERFRKRWPNFMKPRMLMVGCTAGEGQLGSDEPWAVQALQAALEQTARDEKISFLLFKDFPEEYRHLLGFLTKQGYARVPSMPGARMNIESKDFEEFMQNQLGKVFRKNLRRKFKASAAIGALTMDVLTEITPVAEEIQALYLQTHGRSQYQFERLNAGYFEALGRKMPERARFFLWRLEGRLVAFALCLVQGDTLHDLNFGADYRLSPDLNLYFVTFRDLYNWAAANGLKRYATGPLNYDPKLHLQLDLDPLDLYARHTNPVFNVFFKLALKYLEPTRHDPVIRKFRNFKDLI